MGARIILSHHLNMPRIPFPSTGKKNFTTKEERNAFFPLFRGAKRARRDALKDGLLRILGHIPHHSDEPSMQ